jgi:hypothetical protein
MERRNRRSAARSLQRFREIFRTGLDKWRAALKGPPSNCDHSLAPGPRRKDGVLVILSSISLAYRNQAGPQRAVRRRPRRGGKRPRSGLDRPYCKDPQSTKSDLQEPSLNDGAFGRKRNGSFGQPRANSGRWSSQVGRDSSTRSRRLPGSTCRGTLTIHNDSVRHRHVVALRPDPSAVG